ncbi:PREDICTED: uncharacterized protein LOC105568811 [Vollenhovia emeryi]|uniref:uncharacterized protein LOC105568811 n=1 Tax=Vollenhovia emeryi TaxID=411798 RepID=UPI0005F438B1|nr:PREDICTED: uncharacterized protein LOC105568811 [Vollenhovia emeryi]
MSNSKRAPKSDESKQHNDYSLQINRWFLKLIGAWPQINASSTVWKILVLLQIFICASTIASITLPCLLYILFEEINIKAKLKVVGALITRSMGVVNYWVLLTRSSDIHKLIRHMEADWNLIQRFDDREIMLRHARYGRFITFICGTIMQGGTFLYSLALITKTVPIVIDNQTYSTHVFACPIYSKIIDTRLSPVNEIALALQFVSSFLLSCSTVGACSLAAVFAVHACGQLNILCAWLHELVENQEEGNRIVERRLAVIVKHHLRILSFISRMESVMNKVSLVELLGCTIILCFLGHYTIMDWSTFDVGKLTSYFIMYLSMNFNIFIFCYIGEIVTEQCKYVGEVAYMTKWYNIHHKTALGLVLVIAQSSNVIKITAGKLFHLSIATFGDVIKTSMAYLNLLRTMTM